MTVLATLVGARARSAAPWLARNSASAAACALVRTTAL